MGTESGCLHSQAHPPLWGRVFSARALHSDELVLQLWLGDDVHLNRVKQLPGDEVLRNLGRGVAKGSLADLRTCQGKEEIPQDLSPLLQQFSLPSTQAHYSLVSHIHDMFAFAFRLLHMLFPLPGTISPQSTKFLCIQEY